MSDNQNISIKSPTRLDLIKRYGFARWFFKKSQGDAPFTRIIIHIALIAICAIAVYPILRILSVSLRPGSRLFSTDLAIIPGNATMENYENVIFNTNFLKWIWNSFIITVSTSFVGVFIAASSAYAFSRWAFPGRKFGLIFLLSTQMIPGVMMLIPVFILAAQFNLTDSWRGLVFAYSITALPFSIWILKGYYDTIPMELEQSAMVDGATRMGAFFRIILPLSSPALAIAFLFNFTAVWNELFYARVMIKVPEMYTWPLGLQSMQRQFQTQWGDFSAASLMISIPVMILFLTSSKWLVSGLTLGSVKG
jgi:arabinogalactan oligomer/maltooligosaccharide transport system permease protein